MRAAINRKAVYRVIVVKAWFVHQRCTTPRPRVKGRRSRASRSNERWAMDVTHIDCGTDGWARLAAVIDCHDRELVGYEFARRAVRVRLAAQLPELHRGAARRAAVDRVVQRAASASGARLSQPAPVPGVTT